MLCILQTWDEMEQRLHVGPPEPGSEREREFNTNLQSMKDAVLRVISRRREGSITEDIPFIDALLQTQVPEEQVRGTYSLGTFRNYL